MLLDGLGDVALDGRTYNLALLSAVNAKRWEEMEAILDMMQVGVGQPARGCLVWPLCRMASTVVAPGVTADGCYNMMCRWADRQNLTWRE